MAAPIYVVVSQNDKAHPRWGVDKDGPIVHESYTSMTLEQAQARAARMESSGACRVGRVVFEDHPAFNEVRGLCGEGDCHYFGKPRAGSCACSKVPA